MLLIYRKLTQTRHNSSKTEAKYIIFFLPEFVTDINIVILKIRMEKNKKKKTKKNILHINNDASDF